MPLENLDDGPVPGPHDISGLVGGELLGPQDVEMLLDGRRSYGPPHLLFPSGFRTNRERARGKRRDFACVLSQPTRYFATVCTPPQKKRSTRLFLLVGSGLMSHSSATRVFAAACLAGHWLRRRCRARLSQPSSRASRGYPPPPLALRSRRKPSPSSPSRSTTAPSSQTAKSCAISS